MRDYLSPTTVELLKMVDRCTSIDKLFELVKKEKITVQMKSFSSASNLPQKPPVLSKQPPIETLREQIKEAIRDEARRQYLQRQAPRRTSEQLLRAIETCPTIDKLFELVKNEHIVIQMKSFNSASNLPHNPPTGEMLRPDKSPLERLKEQVMDAVRYGG